MACAHVLRAGLLVAAFGAASAAAAASPKPANACPAAMEAYPRPVDPKIDALGLDELTRAADRGNANAQALLGLKYTGSDASVTTDMDKAIALFRKAAAKKDALGEYLLGVAYMGGAGVAKDEAQALIWLKRAGQHGHPDGLYWTGEMTAKGRGGLRASWEKAAPLFTAAARAGAPDAYVELGLMYEQGLGGIAADHEKAAYCYRQGSKLKSQIAQYNLNMLIGAGLIKRQPDDPEMPPMKEGPRSYRVK